MSAPFTLATWNVNSIRARFDRLAEWLGRRSPDLVCLQETKVDDPLFPREDVEALGYRVEFHGQKTYNGVAMLARDELTEVSKGLTGVDDTQKRIIAAEFRGVRVVNVYVPNGQEVGSPKYEMKLGWLDQLREALAKECAGGRPVVLCGDFNIAPEDRDVHDPKRWKDKVLCSEPEREKFRGLLGLGLKDGLRMFHDEPGIYTWWDYRLDGFGRDWGLRLDHILVTEPAAARLRSVEVDRKERAEEKPSDHAPVVARFE